MSTEAKPYTMEEAAESQYFPDNEGIPGTFALGPDMRIASPSRIRATVQQALRLKAELAASESLVSALQEQMARLVEQHAESTKRLVAEAREEQREACAQSIESEAAAADADARSPLLTGIVLRRGAARIRATPLEATPRADALAAETAAHQETKRQLDDLATRFNVEELADLACVEIRQSEELGKTCAALDAVDWLAFSNRLADSFELARNHGRESDASLPAQEKR